MKRCLGKNSQQLAEAMKKAQKKVFGHDSPFGCHNEGSIKPKKLIHGLTIKKSKIIDEWGKVNLTMEIIFS